MSEAYEFLKECVVFFVATVNDTAPAVRPFGAVMEYKGEIYFTTANTKDVYFQMIDNPQIQIIALKTGTREWIRINGKAEEVHEAEIKQIMLDTCPVLLKRFESKDDEHFALFKINDIKSLLSTEKGFIELGLQN